VKTYDLYLESGPQMKTTYVHVPELLGCIWMRPTTDAALGSAPAEIGAYLRFLARAGERANAEAKFATRIGDHYMDGGFLSIHALPTDTEPLSKRYVALLMKRLAALHHDLRALTAPLSPKQLAAQPPKGRPIRRILNHLSVEGAYLRGVKGASRIQRETDEGKLDPLDALDRLHALELERLANIDVTESRVIMRGQSPWTVRSALRRMLEHGWEHYVEIATRLGKTP
jgi:hypothetical protein